MTALALKTETPTKHWSSAAREAARLRAVSNTPWKKSTGPRTKRGKEISSMNAYKHGYYSQEMRNIRTMLRVMDARLQLLIQMRKAEERAKKQTSKLSKKIFSRNELSSGKNMLGSFYRKKHRTPKKYDYKPDDIRLFRGCSP